jgi:hypothetical protein
MSTKHEKQADPKARPVSYASYLNGGEIFQKAVIECVVLGRCSPLQVAHLRPLFDARDAADAMLADVVQRFRFTRC